MGFLQWLAIALPWLASIVFGVIVAGALVTYIRRTWQLISRDSEGTQQQQLLDGLDRIETRLHAMSERLERLEEDQKRLGPGER